MLTQYEANGLSLSAGIQCGRCRTVVTKSVHPPKPTIHIQTYCDKKFPLFPQFFLFPLYFCKIYGFLASPILTMIHLRIMLYTYWTRIVVTNISAVMELYTKHSHG